MLLAEAEATICKEFQEWLPLSNAYVTRVFCVLVALLRLRSSTLWNRFSMPTCFWHRAETLLWAA